MINIIKLNKVRCNTFETNSSSSHSISITRKDSSNGWIITCENWIEVNLLRFPDDRTTVLMNKYDKLSYLMTIAYVLYEDNIVYTGNNYLLRHDKFYSSEPFLEVRDAIRKVTGNSDVDIIVNDFCTDILSEDIGFSHEGTTVKDCLDNFYLNVDLVEFLTDDEIIVTIESHYWG